MNTNIEERIILKLTNATWHGNYDELIEAKLLYGIDLNSREFEVPLLCIAANKGDAALCCLLLGLRVNVNAKDAKNITPLMHAASRGSFEIMKLLLDAGADPEVRDFQGYTAWDYAEYSEDCAKVLENECTLTLKNAVGEATDDDEPLESGYEHDFDAIATRQKRLIEKVHPLVRLGGA